MLQLTDIYQCASLITKSKELSVQLDELRLQTTEKRSPEHFQDTVKQIINSCIQLLISVNERSKLMAQLKYFEILQDAKQVLTKTLQELLTVSKHCFENENDKESEEKRQQLEHVITQSLDDLIHVGQESSKGIFDNLAVDLNLMTVMETTNVEEESLYASICKTQEVLSRLVDCTKKGDKHKAIDELKAIRPLLDQISSHISNCLTANDLVAMTKACLLNPSDEKSFNELTNSVDRLQSALKILLERAKLPTSLTDELRENIKAIIEECETTMEALAQAVFLSNQTRAIQTAKKALKLLNSASELAAGLAERLEDEALTAYFMATNRAIKSTMPPLLTSTKSALLYSEHRPEFIRAKDFALYASFALLPPKNVVHPENQILDQIKVIHEHICILHYHINRGDTQDVNSSLKGVLEAAKEGVRAIQAYIPFAENPHDLKIACLFLANDQMKNLGHVVVESTDTKERNSAIHSTSVANSKILSVILSNHQQRLEENQNNITSLFKQVIDGEDYETTSTKLQDIITEQIVIALSLSQDVGNPKQSKLLYATAFELSAELSIFSIELIKSPTNPTELAIKSVKSFEVLLKKLTAPITPEGGAHGDSQQLLDRISSLPIDDSTTGKLYAASKMIALDLKDLLAGTLSRADMIKCARRICNQAHIIVKQSQLFIGLCKDRRLIHQLQVGSMSARTKCVQLKIICAVKAASNNDVSDASDSEDQLVGCVLGLTKDLHSTISAAEIAALRFT